MNLRRISNYLALLTPGERRKAMVVTVLITLMAGLELLGVASIFPFLSVLGNADSIESNAWVARLYALSGADSREDFLAILAAGSFLLIAGSAAARIYTQYAIHSFAQQQRHALGVRLFSQYLRQPYAFFLKRHSSDLARSIISEVDLTISQFIKPLMDLIAHALVALMLTTLLFLVNPMVATLTVIVIGGFYAAVSVFVRRTVATHAEARLDANRRRYRAATDAIASIKLVKLHRQENEFVQRFSQPSSVMTHSVAVTQTLAQVPRYMAETIAIGGVLVVFLALTLAAGPEGVADVGAVLPLLGLYAFAGYRILPCVQVVYASLSTMRMGAPSLDEVFAELAEELEPLQPHQSDAMPFEHQLELVGVHFAYENAEREVLRDANLVILPGERIGIRGETGSGKSTLVDLILGLQSPTRGELRVDGQKLDSDNLRRWQAGLAYVPQDIVLLDDTVAANIALPSAPEAIDHERLRDAARWALIDDFIESSLPKGYETVVGERGSRLSGGQRQRIGIARALYRQPSLLVLDEATSALDLETESTFFRRLMSLSFRMAIVIISHRNETFESCDKCFLMAEQKCYGIGNHKPFS